MFTPHTYTSTPDQVLFSLYLVKLHKRMYNNMLKLGQLNFLVSLLAIPPLLLFRFLNGKGSTEES